MDRIIYLVLLLMLWTCSLCGQDYEKVDRYALKAPKKISKNLYDLTAYLAKDCSSDLEKVRSFYTWIIHSIDYDRSAYKDNRRRINRTNADVLDRKQAVCFGYTTLFKAMCEQVNIPCEIISGYVKNQQTGVANLSRADHAWNAVKIDSTWYLLDLTWGSAHRQKRKEAYFLVEGETLIFSHLPADPMWQLLDCPIRPGIFRKAAAYVTGALRDQQACFSFRDSIEAYLKLPKIEQRLKTTKNAYYFNPIVEIKSEIGHTYMDYVNVLGDRAAALELTDSTKAIQAIHLQIIAAAQRAEAYIELYDHQKENIAYSHINYAIALSKDLKEAKDTKPVLAEMTMHFEKAKKMLEGLPKNILLENALEQIEGYMEWVESY